MVEELSIDIPGVRLAARCWGPGEGRRVIALHGWLDNAASFDRLAPLLDGLRIVALDMAGHGHSEHRRRGQHYHLSDFVGDVLHVGHALGWERYDLLGHSLGAAIASLAAAACPDRVRSLLLLEGLGPLTEPPDQAASRLRRSADAMRELMGKAPRMYPDLATLVRARKSAGDLSTASARILCERSARIVDGACQWRSDPQLRLPSPYYLTEEQVLAQLEAIVCPVLCIAAENGYLHKRSQMPQRYERVARLRLRPVPGGHHMHLDDPGPTAREIKRFLDHCDAGAQPARD